MFQQISSEASPDGWKTFYEMSSLLGFLPEKVKVIYEAMHSVSRCFSEMYPKNMDFLWF